MLALESPLDAYRSDLRRNPGREDFGTTDTVWILIAHCLQRLSRVAADERATVAGHCSVALRGLIPMIGGEARDVALKAELMRLCDGLDALESADSADEVCRSARAMSARMTNAGALGLAYCAMGHLRCAVPAASAHERGLNFAEQAYIARALGDLDAAEELYQLALAAVAGGRDAEVRTRSLLGRGVVARMRGNYPNARRLFQAGLAEAQEACRDDLAVLAHQALLIAAGVAGDIDTALVHGWAAYKLAGGDESRRVEMLVNLGQLSLEGGYPGAALRAFLAARGLGDVPHYRIAACAGAAVAAARLARVSLVDRLTSEVEALLAVSAMPYMNAQALHSLQIAAATLGEHSRAEVLRVRARELARAGGFFELFHKTEPRESSVTAPVPLPARRELSKRSGRVITSLEELEPVDSDQLLALTL